MSRVKNDHFSVLVLLGSFACMITVVRVFGREDRDEVGIIVLAIAPSCYLLFIRENNRKGRKDGHPVDEKGSIAVHSVSIFCFRCVVF